MESHPSVTDRPLRVPRIAWFLGVGLIVALVAIFVFNAALSTVVYYGFIAVFVGSHFFMHGSHSGHGSSDGQQHGGPVSNAAEADQPDTNQHSGHTGGCH